MNFSKSLLVFLTSICLVSCRKFDSGGVLAISNLEIESDSGLHSVIENRKISVKKNIEKKEFEIDFVFENDDMNDDTGSAFRIQFFASAYNRIDDNNDYKYYKDFSFYKENGDVIEKDEGGSLFDYYIYSSQKIYMSYKTLPSEGIKIFDEDIFPMFQIADILYWGKGKTSGGIIYLKSRNYIYPDS